MFSTLEYLNFRVANLFDIQTSRLKFYDTAARQQNRQYWNVTI